MTQWKLRDLILFK